MSTTADDPPTIPQYKRELFVNREAEAELVREKARQLSTHASDADGEGNDEPPRNRIVIFWGSKGTGRTWLLKHLAELLPELSGVQALYLDLETRKDEKPVEAVEKIIAHIEAQISAWLRGVATEARKKNVFPSDLGQKLPITQDFLANHVLALLLDHVYEADWELLAALEEQLLASLATNQHVLMVLAGRGQAYPWKTPEFRFQVEDYHLKPFDEVHVAQQLQNHYPDNPPKSSDIYMYSHGYPLGTYLLAARPTIAEALRETVDWLLTDVPMEERSWLEALCILQAFDEERIPVFLTTYLDDPSILQWSYAIIRQTRDRLLRTRMVRWHDEAGGWVIDQAVRQH